MRLKKKKVIKQKPAGKKAQAAMEFIMTYGWAILVVLAAVSGLAYFGVFKYTKLLPEQCALTSALACEDYLITNSTATFVLRNGMGSGMTITRVTLGDCDVNVSDYIPYGSSKVVDIAGCNNGPFGTVFKEDLTVYYRDSRSGFEHRVLGNVVGRVQSS